MQTLNLCDKCGKLVDRPLIKVRVTKGVANDTSEWSICDFCEEASHFKPIKPVSGIELTAPEEPKRELPKDKRVVRTKSTGDNVYEVDEVAKTKRWVRNPEVLKALGWELNDVQEVDDKDLLGYAMTASVYRVED